MVVRPEALYAGFWFLGVLTVGYINARRFGPPRWPTVYWLGIGLFGVCGALVTGHTLSGATDISLRLTGVLGLLVAVISARWRRSG
jgi:hypothetical protein